MYGHMTCGKRFEVAVRTGPGPEDFSPAAGFDTYEAAAANAAAVVMQHWDFTTGYAYVGSIVDNAVPTMPGHKVADIEGQYFTVTNVRANP